MEPIELGMPSKWRTGLFDCRDDQDICLRGLFCPCFLFEENVKRTHSPITFRCPCFLYAYHIICCSCYHWHKQYRFQLRIYYGLPAGCGDCPTTFFCGQCALCQEARELNLRAGEPREFIRVQPGARY